MKRVFLFCVAALLFNAAHATVNGERDSLAMKKRVHYFFSFGMGTMIGCTACKTTGNLVSFTSSTIHGVRIGKHLSLGAGVGFDAYERWTTMPIFSTASWTLFGLTKNRFFVKVDYGYSPAWLNKSARDSGYKSESGGEMFYPALGYRIRQGNARLSFSVGYKFQRVFANYEGYAYYPYCPYCDNVIASPAKKEVRTDMSRIVFDMSIGWR